MPVYQGERFLANAIDAVLAQDFEDFELIISDNGSTDATQEICRQHAKKDDRIRYFRYERNRGAAWNFNHVFDLARGELFKWVAADDEHAPTYLSSCVAALEAEPDAVVAHTRTVDIDDDGVIIRRWTDQPDADAPTPHERLRRLLSMDHECFSVFGLIRTSVLARTMLIGAYTDSDAVLVGELALYGRLVEIPEESFLHREHSGRSVVVNTRSRARSGWFDPQREHAIVFPAWRMGVEYLRAIGRAQLAPAEAGRCYAAMGVWLRRNWIRMVRNLAWAGRELTFRAVRSRTTPAP